MNIVLIGANICNSHVTDYFARKGLSAASITDVYDIRALNGEVGNFTVHTKDSEIKADFVVLTEQPRSEVADISGFTVMSLFDDQNVVVSGGGKSELVVFLLDYFCESPMAATIRALNDAVVFARNKRQVFFLAKFIRTAGRGVEALYKEAREIGVTFIKYEGIRFNSSSSDDDCVLLVSDGELEVEIKTGCIYSDGGLDVGERFEYAVRKLNLTTTTHGYLTEDRYFLSPALTSRRGVYHLTRDLAFERLDEGLNFIYAHALGGICESTSHGVAQVDGKKCVFCYNCYRSCPHAALMPDFENSQMQCLSLACAGCGICAGLCPATAIALERYVALRIGDNVGSLLICCENLGEVPLEGIEGVDVQSVPCGGIIDVRQLSEGLFTYSKVLAVVCPDGACRHFDGNKRACTQTERFRDLLVAAGLSADKMRYAQVSVGMPKALEEFIIHNS